MSLYCPAQPSCGEHRPALTLARRAPGSAEAAERLSIRKACEHCKQLYKPASSCTTCKCDGVQAVDATKNVEGGNVHLQKAIRLNTSARWYIFMLFMVASLGLLFLDWFSS